MQYEKDSRIRIKVTLNQPGVLVLSESSYPGWRVSVNGETKTCLWLNLLFQGVELSPGQNEIIFEFRPEHFLAFASVSVLSLCIVCGVFFSPLFFRKRNRKQTLREGVP